MNPIHSILSAYTHDFLGQFLNKSMLVEYVEPVPTVSKVLNVMSLTFTYKAAIRGYESIVIQRVWNGISRFTMNINSEVTNANLIEADDIVWFDNEYNKAFIIETIEETLNGDSIDYEIIGTSLATLVKDFITVPSGDYDTATGTPEAVVRQWVTNNCIARPQYPIVLGTLKDFGASITEQTRYKNLAEEISRVLVTYDLGYEVVLDLVNSQFVFNVLQGTSRISTQSVNVRILFGLKYGNISEYRKIKDKSKERNYAYVGGQGDLALRTIVIVDSSTTRKKEVFIDARDTDITAELTERGEQSLSESAEVNGFEFEALERQFKYEVDYDLGDFVTVVINSNNFQHLQIREITEYYVKNAIRTEMRFGKPETTLTNVITAINSKITKLQTV